MTVNTAVRTLHNDLTKMRDAKSTEKKAVAGLTQAGVTEKAKLATIAAKSQSIIDQFTNATTPIPAPQAQKLLTQQFNLGKDQANTVSRFDATVTKDNKAIAKDKTAISADRKVALKDLHPAELHMNLKDTNRVRNELGLKSVNKVIRPPAHEGLNKAVKIATQAVDLQRKTGCYDYTQDYGARTNYDLGPLKTHGGRITYDCSGFVGAVYKAAGLPAPYTVGYGGTSFDVAGNPKMQKVSEGQAKPGDVVVFPDHIALYIGGGKCISMGQEGDPAVVTVAAEAAYHDRGIEGFYHAKGT